MSNLRGAYLTFVHDRPADWDWLRQWQPSVIRLMLQGSHTDPASVDVNRIRRVHETCPDALILLRCWDVDDRNFEAHAAMFADPEAEANRQHDWWARLLDRVQGMPRALLMAGANNEPDTRRDGNALYDYTARLVELGKRDALRYGVYCFSVGNPAKDGEHRDDWKFYRQLEDDIVGANCAVILHEYMQPEGMYGVWTDAQGNARHDWRNLMGRHLDSGLTRAKIIIGEWGLDGLLFNRFPDHTVDDNGHEYGNNGWRNFRTIWPPERYADEYVEYIRQAAPNVVGVCGFISDQPARKWSSFDMLDAYGALLSRKALCVKPDVVAQSQPHIVNLPSLPNGPVTVTPPTVDTTHTDNAPGNDTWARCWPVVLHLEGGLSLDPNDRGNYYNGQLVGTKFGISAAVWGGQYDIPNLTQEQALEIYRDHYWRGSGADQLAWPLCLVHFDTAVNAGVMRAHKLMAQSGGDWALYLLRRLQWYQSLDQYPIYGEAWSNRVYYLADVVANEKPAG